MPPGGAVKILASLALVFSLIAPALAAAAPVSILFIGNSFVFGSRSAAMHYRAGTVRDLNGPDARGETIGGVPAIFKAFTQQAGLDYDVSLETAPGRGLDYHLAEKRALIERPWDVVVMHGFSTLDRDRPGDPALLVATARDMTGLLLAQNPAAKIWLMATWSRADLTYPPGTPWHDKPIQQMGLDVAAGYALAQQASAPWIVGVIPVGLAWNRAIDTGIADDNPYDDVGASKINLWAYDHYHASAHGYYLEALLHFGAITGLDPRTLSSDNFVAEDLGISPAQARALQQVAFDELAARSPAPQPVLTQQPVATAER
jgi:hypothetical protein